MRSKLAYGCLRSKVAYGLKPSIPVVSLRALDTHAPRPIYSAPPVQRLSKKVLKLPTAVNSPKPSNVQNKMQAKR